MSTVRGFVLLVSALALISAPIHAHFGMIATRLVENGDGDGFLDTRETVQYWVTLRNEGADSSDLVVSIATDSEWVACLGVSRIPVASMLSGEVVEVGPFRWTMSDLDRLAASLGPDDPIELIVEVSITDLSAQSYELRPSTRSLQVDVDALGGSAPSTFVESFESATFGSFEAQNLDSGLDSLAASDGYRCQYNDPDNPDSNNVGRLSCFLGGAPGSSTQFNWKIDGSTLPASQAVDGGRAYDGTHSLYFGTLLDNVLLHTTPLGVLEAVATSEPVYLGWEDVCSITRSQNCFDAGDCPGGEACVQAAPLLRFKQQVSFVDERLTGNGPADRGIVMGQLADSNGVPIGNWFRLEPQQSPYHSLPHEFSNCTFDPIDDGSTEDDLFPLLGALGPSSTCRPQRVWSHVGDTDQTPAQGGDTGLVFGAPLPGSLGTGSWIETEIDLSAFRGRGLRFRYLASTIELGSDATWEQWANLNPSDRDDGWWIDDVVVTDTLSTSATLMLDSNPNLGLDGLADPDADAILEACDNCDAVANANQIDTDLDTVGDACDNCPQDFNTDQLDADSDGIGDLCDPCPNGDAGDADGDGVGCIVDNCRDLPNASQADLDADGQGDLCDPCPADALDDADGDAVCADVDTCPTRKNPSQVGAVRLEAGGEAGFNPLAIAGGKYVVYRSPVGPLVTDPDGLYSMPTGAGPVVRISSGIADRNVTDFASGSSSPGDTVVFVESAPSPQNLEELFIATVRGQSVRRLASEANILSLLVTSDHQTALYSTSDGSVVAIDVDTGVVTELASGFTNLSSLQLSPDETWVVFVGRLSGIRAIYAVPLAGGVPQRINGTSAADTNFDLQFGPLIALDSSRVIYRADTPLSGFDRLFSAPIDGSSFAVPISGSSNLQDNVTGPVELHPDGTRVMFVLQPGGIADAELRISPIDGSSAPTTLATSAGGVSWFGQIGATANGSACLYTLGVPAEAERYLYNVPCGGGLARLLTPAIPAGGTVGEFAPLPDSSRVIFTAEQDSATTFELYNVRPQGGAVTKISGPLVGGGNVEQFRLMPDGSLVLYRADAATDQSFELLSVPPLGGAIRVLVPDFGGGSSGVSSVSPFVEVESGIATVSVSHLTPGYSGVYAVRVEGDDLDSDGLIDFCDTCPDVADPSQLDLDGDGAGAACDCNDSDAWVVPGGGEVCDGVDSDCDNVTPGDESDADTDGYLVCENYVGSAPGIVAGGDCNDAESSTFPGAAETNDGFDNQCDANDPGAGLVDELLPLSLFTDAVTFVAVAQAGAVTYEFARATDDPTFSGGGCLIVSQSNSAWVDPEIPNAGQLFSYLARAAAPFPGSWGQQSTGVERSVVCP